MAPYPTFDPAQDSQPVSVDIAELADRLVVVERKHRQLKRTLDAVAREAGVSIGCPCSRCEQSYVLVSKGLFSCPVCGYQESM